jgi:hypothetical protein
MTLVTAVIPSPLTRTTLPGTARAMPWHVVRQVMASMTGRGAADDAAAVGVAAGAVAGVGDVPPVGGVPPVGDGL